MFFEGVRYHAFLLSTTYKILIMNIFVKANWNLMCIDYPYFCSKYLQAKTGFLTCYLAMCLFCSTYEVATACAIELQADKLISCIDGPLLDARGELIRFMTLQGADELIRNRAQQSETASNYVKAVAGIDYMKSLGVEASKNGKENSAVNGSTYNFMKENQSSRNIQNGDGAERGQGLAIGGEERLSKEHGYLSELTAAVFVCRVMQELRRFNLLYMHQFVTSLMVSISCRGACKEYTCWMQQLRGHYSWNYIQEMVLVPW